MCLSELAIESVFVDRKETTTKNKQTNNQANTNKQTKPPRIHVNTNNINTSYIDKLYI
jgi:hypothetical protein